MRSAFWMVTATLALSCGGHGTSTTDSSSGSSLDTNEALQDAEPVDEAMDEDTAVPQDTLVSTDAEVLSEGAMPANTVDCADWVIDDFEGESPAVQWYFLDNPEVDGLVSSLLDPVPSGTQQALHLALEFPESTAVDISTHFHGIYPHDYSAMTFRARTDSDVPVELIVAIVAVNNAADWAAPAEPWKTVSVSLTDAWQQFRIATADVIRAGEAYSPTNGPSFHFTLRPSVKVDVWLDDVVLSCAP